MLLFMLGRGIIKVGMVRTKKPELNVGFLYFHCPLKYQTYKAVFLVHVRKLK